MDTKGPSASVIINGARAYWSSRTVNLEPRATDPAPRSGLAFMRLKNNGCQHDQVMAAILHHQVVYADPRSGQEDGSCSVKDQAGNISVTAWDSIRMGAEVA